MSMGELSSDNDAFVPGDVPVGSDPDHDVDSEAMVAWLLQQEDVLAKIDEGCRQLEAGDYVEFDEEGLRQFFEGLKERARRRAQGS